LGDVALLRLYPEEETMNFDNLSPILLRSIVPLRRSVRIWPRSNARIAERSAAGCRVRRINS
jgi:hypothetical protein